MVLLRRLSVITVPLLLVASLAAAQSWRGMARAAGKVTDESGKPLERVVVKLSLPGAGGMEVKTNKKGEWAAGGLARGEWQVDFELPTYEPRRISLSLSELTRIPPVEIALKQDINEVIRIEMVKAGELMQAQKPAEARAVYEAVLAKYPDAHRVEPYIARTYYTEKNLDKAIEHLKIAVQHDPADQENRLRLGNILMEAGRLDEGRQVMASVDDSLIKDPAIYVNVGIALLNQNQADQALPYFEKAIARFPGQGEAYYYRALVRLQKGDVPGTRADLTKFLELAPNAPEAPAAKKALEQLNK
jgi:tetratricopeptide (TPR) repeat protein